ncbi:hypothetical protein GIB67_039500 [Kingdonia uniflora]|uniref:Cation/H+ exchanger transmembrane domain-containing protein n=1 Tax=Kingdonia uniflora TaxID=39325 RepID=A0A7J7LIQ1_9MAGN|nr:hypothetical protein GIB67_039500 [Kingdonia uniflora]
MVVSVSPLNDILSSANLDSSSFSISTVFAITLFFTLICACIVIGHLLEEHRWANESITALLLGLCSGGVVLLVSKGKSSQILVFSESLFFIYLLPPIIFNAGFQVKKKQFFHNFSTILLFGVVGTLISFCIISLEIEAGIRENGLIKFDGGNLSSYFLFRIIGVTTLKLQDYLAVGAIFSATDSVCTLQVLNQDQTPLLYSLVFGEGVVNDATSIVLFNAVQALDFKNFNAVTALKLLGTFLYLFFTSTLLGIAVTTAPLFARLPDEKFVFLQIEEILNEVSCNLILFHCVAQLQGNLFVVKAFTIAESETTSSPIIVYCLCDSFYDCLYLSFVVCITAH